MVDFYGFHVGKDTVFNGILHIISSPNHHLAVHLAPRWSQKAEKMKVKGKRLESTKPVGFGEKLSMNLSMNFEAKVSPY